MKTVPFMSIDDERRLISAVEAAAEDPDSDSDPDASLAKAAARAGVPGGHVDLLVRAYNTARSAFQRETGGDAPSKAAAFPLASSAGVTRALYPDPDPTPSEKKAGVSPEYSGGPDWYRTPAVRTKDAAIRAEFEQRAALIKAASASAPKPTDDFAFQRVYKQAHARIADLGNKRSALFAVRMHADDLIEKAADAIASRYSPTFADFKAAASASMGGFAQAVFDEIARRRPELAALPAREPYHDVRKHAGVYALVRDAADAGVHAADEQARFQDDCEAVERKVAEDLAPFLDAPNDGEEAPGGFSVVPGVAPAVLPDMNAPAPAADPLLGLPALPGEGEPKEASVPVDVAKGLSITMLRDKLDKLHGSNPVRGAFEPRVQRALDTLRDPAHDARLRDLENQYLIHDMLLNDDVIGSHDPDDVAAVVNEIARTAPRQVAHPMLARPLIRRALEMGGLDTFDAGEALGAESKLHQLAQPTQAPSFSPPNPGQPNAPAGRPKIG